MAQRIDAGENFVFLSAFLRVALVVGVLVTGGLAAGVDREVRAQSTDEPFAATSFAVALDPIAQGFDQPVYVTGPDDGSGRLFVVERPGRIRIVMGGEVLAAPFLDITSVVQSGGMEQGLFSVAFPPDYSESGRFYVYYTARSGEGAGDNTVSRYRVSAADPNVAEPESGEVLLTVRDDRVNHNGGQLQFGPDGMLYVGLGDGGGGGDPEGNGQNPMTLLGSILRIDVAGDGAYSVPDDNPFADGENGAPETWVWGLRNPWRFSFDQVTGDLWIGDVGQNAREEVNWLPPDAAAGANLGWNVVEGTLCFRAEQCDTTGLTLPVAEYSRESGCSVVGGYVYRGARETALNGVYLFADYCTGLIWGLGRDAAGSWAMSAPIESGLRISSFGEDAAGELYVVGLGGELARVRGAN
jgi:glucose/arabinose dehydrogenase